MASPSRATFLRRRAVLAALLLLLVWWVLPGRGGSGGPTTTTTAVPTAEVADGFEASATQRLRAQGVSWTEACDRSDPADDAVLRAYGAVLVAPVSVTVPPTCRFGSPAEAAAFQSSLAVRTEVVGGVQVRLQSAAMAALLSAVAEADAAGHRISPRDDDASARTYEQGVALWSDRVGSGLAHWRRAGRLSRDEADRIAALTPEAQVAEVLRLEADGLLFGTGQDGPILGSVAAPGTSQHLSLLAFDVAQDTDPAVTAALADHGWHRTVRGDRPHLTYLGRPEVDLPAAGLRSEDVDGVAYWVPDI